jgi:hypothetical protein
MAKCENGHENAAGQRFCGHCGVLIEGAPNIAKDFVFAALTALGGTFAVLFVLAMFGAHHVGDVDRVTDYALVAGNGAAPWAIAALLAWGGAYRRARHLMRMARCHVAAR